MMTRQLGTIPEFESQNRTGMMTSWKFPTEGANEGQSAAAAVLALNLLQGISREHHTISVPKGIVRELVKGGKQKTSKTFHQQSRTDGKPFLLLDPQTSIFHPQTISFIAITPQFRIKTQNPSGSDRNFPHSHLLLAAKSALYPQNLTPSLPYQIAKKARQSSPSILQHKISSLVLPRQAFSYLLSRC